MDSVPSPLRIDDGGVIRVGKTRVTLDTVIGAFAQGACAEEIVDRYPSLSVPDVHGALEYYLSNRGQVDDYLAERRQRAAEIRREVEALCGDGLRKKLRERRIRRACS